MSADIKLTWQNGVHFIAKDNEENAINIDGSPKVGGSNQGTRPMMMVLMGLAGCASIDIVGILNKSKQPFKEFHVEVTAKRSDNIPKVFTDIDLLFQVYGEVAQNRLDHAVKLSVDKYCSVATMLNPTVNITFRTEIHK